MRITKGDRIFAVTALVLFIGFGLYGLWLHSEKFQLGQYELKSRWENKNGTKNFTIIEIKPDGQYIEQTYWGIQWVSEKPNPKLLPRNLTYTIHPDGTYTERRKGTYVVTDNDIDLIQDSGPNSVPRFRVRTGRFTRNGLVIVRQFSVMKMEDIDSGRRMHDTGVPKGELPLYAKIK